MSSVEKPWGEGFATEESLYVETLVGNARKAGDICKAFTDAVRKS